MRLWCANRLAMMSLFGLAACDEVSYPTLGEEFESSLAGANVVPAVTTNASGLASFAVVEDTVLIFSVSLAAIDSTTAVHIHEGAAGVAGGTVILTLFTGATACKQNAGSALSITSSSVASPTVITTGTAHAQTVGNTGLVRIAGHSGSTPSLNGEHTATYTAATTFTIPVDVTVGGTGGTAQRFTLINTASPRCRVGYAGPAGVGQLRPAQLTQLPAGYGATPVERMAELIARMRAGTVYVDVHTSVNTGGEVRGQIAIR